MTVRSTRWLSPALLTLFLLSGFAGLVYQSIWSHYLGLMLGHAAYAQTLVLAMFMGGMALGAWWVSRYADRLRRLVLGYAVVEIAIGVLGLVFHPVFEASTAFSREQVLPALGSPTAASLWQWSLAAVLIAPQTILLGASFPLLSAGLLRARTGVDGEVLGGLYFTNSLGAVFGVLASTYLLLPWGGMPGTVAVAGVLNLLVGVGAWAASRAMGEARAPAPVDAPASPASAPAHGAMPPEAARLGRILLATTFLSSAASFTYEIGWIRLLNQALGTTIHSFELMLAAFILGLALGGLWVRRRAAAIGDVVRYAGFVQVWMGVAALLSVPVFTQSFEWVGWIMGAVQRSESGYTLFSAGSAVIALLVMFPAAFFAGMTLPLFTSALLRAGAGEASIGRIYAANTLGAIVGVLCAVHVLIPLLGVRLAVTTAAFADVLIGLALLRLLSPGRWTAAAAVAGVASVCTLGFSLVAGTPDPVRQTSGVFRTGVVERSGVQVVHLTDGKTSTVSMTLEGGYMSIATNGKSDASLGSAGLEPTDDEITMVMLGLMPLAAHPAPESVALIGWGSGLSTHTVLGSPVPTRVDTIEIEPAMREASRLYGGRVVRAFEDPRSHVRIDDARTFFATDPTRYDVIVSEPSNPWVSGVASLFTEEFYRTLHGKLQDDGVLVQWLHSYELDDALLATMLAALQEVFPDARVYATNAADLVIVANRAGTPHAFNADAWNHQPLAAELQRVGLVGEPDVALRLLAGPAMLRNYVALHGATPHSDYYPTVSLLAPRARFLGAEAVLLQRLPQSGFPVADLLECRLPQPLSAGVTVVATSPLGLARQSAAEVAAVLRAGALDEASARRLPAAVPALTLLLEGPRPGAEPAFADALAYAAAESLGPLAPADLEGAWIAPAWGGDPAAWPPAFARARAAFEATARRDAAGMRAAAEAALADPTALASPRLREQMLVIAMLGAIGSGAQDAVPLLDEKHGAIGGQPQLLHLRSYLLAWAATEGAGCAAGVD